MNSPRKEAGSTLLVSMIMLVVLTLLVVFSIRSGNTNLRIAGNMQSQAEASAATQRVIEQVIEQIKVTENLALIPAQTVAVATGGATYTVKVEALNKCLVEVPVLTTKLDTSKANDMPCFEGIDPDIILDKDGKPIPKLSACKTQQWNIQAGVTDDTSGTKVSQIQGITIRVPSTVDCP